MSRIVYGTNPVQEALNHTAGQVQKLIVAQGKTPSLKTLFEQAKSNGIVVEQVSKKDLDRLTKGGRHQGIVCVMKDFAYTSVKDFLSKQSEGDQIIVVADRIEDPQNIGSILRAMGAFGADLLVIGKKTQRANYAGCGQSFSRWRPCCCCCKRKLDSQHSGNPEKSRILGVWP